MTEDLHKGSIFLWVKLHLLYRINKVFSDQNLKDKRYRETMLFFEFYRERSIFNNIENVLRYFKDNPSDLTSIVEIIDADIHPLTKWTYFQEKGDYVFRGEYDGRVYEVNLFTGILLKNGSELAGLPECIKKNEVYVQIFGENRDLEVYPEKDGSLRTRSDFSLFLPNEPNALIFFEFKVNENELIIRKIVKRGNKEFKYILIPLNVLEGSNVELPELYAKLCYAWYC
jgi:hypothetical protein